jgi:5-methylcytosine-specific restriction endonuclease McrA
MSEFKSLFTGIDPFYYSPQWKALHDAVLARDHGICRYCGEKGVQADHVIPRRKGGPDTLNNLVCCCPRCNKLLGGKQFISFKEKKRWLQKELHPRLKKRWFRRK